MSKRSNRRLQVDQTLEEQRRATLKDPRRSRSLAHPEVQVNVHLERQENHTPIWPLTNGSRREPTVQESKDSLANGPPSLKFSDNPNVAPM